MLKKITVITLFIAVALSAAACSSSNTKNASPNPSASASEAASPSANPDLEHNLAYIAARLAEEKVDRLFHSETSADGKPVLAAFTPDKDAAAKFLNYYMDSALTEKILAFYLTDEKADNAIVVKADKFFSASILATASKTDVAFEASDAGFKLTTKDNGVYTVNQNADGNYIVTDYFNK
ncbi:hypothetical protein [Cohnella yongneupensis]|uniref:FAS1 domain-containing protein n=1 Tax=Cohnella yongneupensis TaxID=425006 RepID=A0ABW0RA42_9BACL